MPKLPIAAIILSYNESKNIEKCLKSVWDWADEVIVIDSFSTDDTLDIAKKYTDKIYQNKYDGGPQQWQWALKSIPIKNNWIFAIDADFIVTTELWKEISRSLDRLNDEMSGFYVRHKQVFKGKPILHGGVYPNYWLRLFRKDRVKMDESELVDTHFYVFGKTRKLEYDVIEYNLKDEDLFFWIEKQNEYAKKQAQEEIERKKRLKNYTISPNIYSVLDKRKLFFENFYYSLPLFIRPFLYFFYRYIICVGFLDGKAGLIYHFTQGLLYRILVDLYIFEIVLQNKRKGRWLF